MAEMMDKNLDELKQEVAEVMKNNVGVVMDGKRKGTVRTKIVEKVQGVFRKELSKK